MEQSQKIELLFLLLAEGQAEQKKAKTEQAMINVFGLDDEHIKAVQVWEAAKKEYFKASRAVTWFLCGMGIIELSDMQEATTEARSSIKAVNIEHFPMDDSIKHTVLNTGAVDWLEVDPDNEEQQAISLKIKLHHYAASGHLLIDNTGLSVADSLGFPVYAGEG